jgi:hypothetical protein
MLCYEMYVLTVCSIDVDCRVYWVSSEQREDKKMLGIINEICFDDRCHKSHRGTTWSMMVLCTESGNGTRKFQISRELMKKCEFINIYITEYF